MSRRRPGSRHHAALNPRRWAAARRACFDRDGWRCSRCGGAGALECHHVVELRDGGELYALENLSTLCRACHISEHRREPNPGELEWRALVNELM